MRWRLKLGKDKEAEVELREVHNGKYVFKVDGEQIVLRDVKHFPYSIETNQGGLSIETWTKRQWRAAQAEKVWIVEPQSFGEASGAGEGVIRSQMPGRVLELCVSEGEKVSKGQKLLIMEAMKMENEILCETNGTVKKLHVSKSQSIEADQILVELESSD